MQYSAIDNSFISVKNLSVKTLAGNVFESVSFSAQKGQVVALFGADGSGKTALMLTLGGRMKPTSGDAFVGGFNLVSEYKKIRDISGVSLIKNVNDVPEYLSVIDIITAEFALCGKGSNKENICAYLDEWRFLELSEKKIDSLNPNEKMEFDLMLACVSGPELLLLDCVGAGMTYRRTAMLVDHLKIMAQENNLCVLFTTHEYDIAKEADSVVVLSVSAEEQRLRVIRDQGICAICNVAGSGNGVVCKEFLSAPAKRGRVLGLDDLFERTGCVGAGARGAGGVGGAGGGAVSAGSASGAVGGAYAVQAVGWRTRLGDLFSEEALSVHLEDEEITQTCKEVC